MNHYDKAAELAEHTGSIELLTAALVHAVLAVVDKLDESGDDLRRVLDDALGHGDGLLGVLRGGLGEIDSTLVDIRDRIPS